MIPVRCLGRRARLGLEMLDDRITPVVIDNGIPPGTPGQFGLDVGNGGDVLASLITTPDGSPNNNFIFDSFNLVRINGGPGILLSDTTITMPATLVGANTVASAGSFSGANGLVNWSVTTTIAPGSQFAQTVVSFTADGPIGALQFINYLDEDVFAVGDDILRVVPPSGGANVQLFTIDQPTGIGFAQSVDTTLANASFVGFAADAFPLLRSALFAGNVNFSLAGNVNTANLSPIGPGTFGPADVTTALAWDIDPNATSATLSFRLGTANMMGMVDGSFAIAAGAGGLPLVNVYNPDATLRAQFLAFPAAFSGGVRLAQGDVTGDGVPDIVVAAGPGGGPIVSIFSGVDFSLVDSFFAYDLALTGGVFIALGDLDGDGVLEIITGPGSDPFTPIGPHVQVFRVLRVPGQPVTVDRTPLLSFFAYPGLFPGGVRVAAGDVNGNGRDEIITAAGPGGGPVVSVFAVNIFDPAANPILLPPPEGNFVALENGLIVTLELSFFAYDPSFFGGVFVAVGNVDDDPAAEIITGADNIPDFEGSLLQDLLPNVTGITDPQALAALTFNVPNAVVVRKGNGDRLAVFTGIQLTNPDGSAYSGGVRLAVVDFNGDGRGDIITGAGENGSGAVQYFFSQPSAEFGTIFVPTGPAFSIFSPAEVGPFYQGSVFVAGTVGTTAVLPPDPPVMTFSRSALDQELWDGVFLGGVRV